MRKTMKIYNNLRQFVVSEDKILPRRLSRAAYKLKQIKRNKKREQRYRLANNF